MKTNTIYKILILLTIICLLIITFSTISYAGIKPSDIDGNVNVQAPQEYNDFIDGITGFVQWAGSFIAVGALMVIGIKYMIGSTEDKANYKKNMMPYIIGCFILFGAANIVPQISDALGEIGTDKDKVASSILGIIQAIGTFVSIGALMILGIKYMMGSVEERASYKKSMLPYIIGAILLFGAVNIAGAIYNFIPNDAAEVSEPQSGGAPRNPTDRVNLPQ